MNRPIFWLSFLSFVTLTASPSLTGGRGLFRVWDARTEGGEIITTALDFMFHRERVNQTGQYRGPLLGPSLNYSLSRFGELFGSFAGTFAYQSYPFKNYFYDWQGYTLGTKLSVPVIPVVKLGVLGFSRVEKNNKIFLDSVITKGTGLAFLLTLDFSELFLNLPYFNFNYGRTQSTNFLGTAFEFTAKSLNIFLETTAEHKKVENLFSNDAQIRFTPGFKIRFPIGLGLRTGVELGLTESTEDYRAILGFEFASPLIMAKKPKFGNLVGRIVDENSQKPLAAKISLLNPIRKSSLSDSTSGIFVLNNIPAGAVILEIKKDGYQPQTIPITVKEDEYSLIEGRLKPLVATGSIAGLIVDAQNSTPIPALVRALNGEHNEPTTTDSVTGTYHYKNLPVGIYTLKVEKAGYGQAVALVEVKEQETVLRDFRLVKVGTRIILRDIKFDFDKATIRPESYLILDEAAKILKDNPKIRVEIQGHTDNMGSKRYNEKLSQARAQAVVNYFIERHKISPEKLFARGYGETKPLISNSTKYGRQQNRRVEFLVLDVE